MKLSEAIKKLEDDVNGELGLEFLGCGVTISRDDDRLKIEKAKDWYSALFCVDWVQNSPKEPAVEEISAQEAMKRLEEQSGKKVKIIR